MNIHSPARASLLGDTPFKDSAAELKTSAEVSKHVHGMIKNMDNDLIHEIHKLHEDGQYFQIVQRLRMYKLDKIPAGINVSFVVEAIVQTFRSSSNEDDIWQTIVLIKQLKHEGHLNTIEIEELFNAVGEAILNTKGDIPFFLISGLLGTYDQRAPEKLISLYARANTREAKIELTDFIGSFCNERSLFVLVDNLYSQQIVGGNHIHTILKQHSLLAENNLEPDECDAIISAVLNYLESPGHRIENSDDEKKYEIERKNRTSAARILMVLNGYPKISKETRARIQSKGNLIVTYHCADRMHDYFVEMTINDYLSGRIR